MHCSGCARPHSSVFFPPAWFVTAIGDEDEQFNARKEETDRLYILSRGTAVERASALEEALSYVS